MIPAYVTRVTERLREKGFDAYLAGGCVRDFLMGLVPHDYDIATDATPDEVLSVFSDFRSLLQGAAHGTVCVVSEGENIEITTYRSDGKYSDKRHPDSVTFSRTPEDDMARRDLTINAMMMDTDGNIIDICGGREDLAKGIIRCVGDPERRFGEDALRIMRALRFASVLGFEIEERTAQAVHGCRELLREIAVERISDELTKLLMGEQPERILCDYPDVLSVFIPEIAPCVGFDQMSPYHSFDVWTRIAKAVQSAPRIKRVRLAMMLHDIAKPSCCTEYGGGRHFKGHDELSAQMAAQILTRLRFDNRTLSDVTSLVRYHEIKPEKADTAWYRLLYGKLGRELFCDLFEVALADNLAKGTDNSRIHTVMPLRDEILAYADGGGCTRLSELAVNGADLEAAGLSGREIGKALDYALNAAANGTPNRKDVLLDLIGRHFSCGT